MEKLKPTITTVVIPDDKLQFLKKKLDNPNVSQFLKRDFTREILGGTCSICEEPPTKIATYRMESISMIERYCDKCLEKLSLE
jgi:hypothetical protein